MALCRQAVSGIRTSYWIACIMLCVASQSHAESDTRWQPDGMSREEWDATLGMGYQEYSEWQQLMNQYAGLYHTSLHPDDPDDVTDTFYSQGPHEGTVSDIIYSTLELRDMIAQMTGNNERQKRAVGIDLDEYPFQKYQLPVAIKIDSVFASWELDILNYALDEMERLTCITYDLRPLNESRTEEHVLITRNPNDTGCYTYVGKGTSVPRPIYMGDYCFYGWIVMAHEMAHALGVNHEQQRPDRDDHVTIDWDNLQYGAEIQFAKLYPEYVTYADTPYDVGSMMHYHPYSFLSQNYTPTIMPHDATQLHAMGQIAEISFYDAMWLNNMYCADVCATKLPCQNGGYTDVKDCSKCRCPDEWSGTLCQNLASGSDDCLPLSGELELDETNPKVCVQSPGFKTIGYFTEGDSCTWRIKAPADYLIKMWITAPSFLLYDFYLGACFHWLELKYKDTHSIRGHRICGVPMYSDPDYMLYSSLPEVTAIFRSPPVHAVDLGFTINEGVFRGFEICFEIFTPPGPEPTLFPLTTVEPCPDVTLPCENGGNSSTVCTCAKGYTGELCQEEIEPCDMLTCLNGGSCVKVEPGEAMCLCADGFTGDWCEADIDECAVNNGGCQDQCYNSPGFYFCHCHLPYMVDDTDPSTCIGGFQIFIRIKFPGIWDPDLWNTQNSTYQEAKTYLIQKYLTENIRIRQLLLLIPLEVVVSFRQGSIEVIMGILSHIKLDVTQRSILTYAIAEAARQTYMVIAGQVLTTDDVIILASQLDEQVVSDECFLYNYIQQCGELLTCVVYGGVPQCVDDDGTMHGDGVDFYKDKTDDSDGSKLWIVLLVLAVVFLCSTIVLILVICYRQQLRERVEPSPVRLPAVQHGGVVPRPAIRQPAVVPYYRGWQGFYSTTETPWKINNDYSLH